jgi:hypothetical protein
VVSATDPYNRFLDLKCIYLHVLKERLRINLVINEVL